MDTTPLTKRIRMVQGQLDGIIKMMGNETACVDVLTQLKAARAGLDKATALFVQAHLTSCIGLNDIPDAKKKEIERVILELAKS